MAGITKAQADARLTEYLTAEQKVLGGQSYQIAGRSMTRANLKEIRDGIDYWNGMVLRLSRGGIPARGVIPA